MKEAGRFEGIKGELLKKGFKMDFVGGVSDMTTKNGRVTVFFKHPNKAEYPYVLYMVKARTNATLLRANAQPLIMHSYIGEDGRYHIKHIPFNVKVTVTGDFTEGFKKVTKKADAGFLTRMAVSKTYKNCNTVHEVFDKDYEWVDRKNKVSNMLAKEYFDELSEEFATVHWGILDWSDVKLLKLKDENTSIGLTTCSNGDATVVPYIHITGEKQMKLHRYKVMHLPYAEKRKLVEQHCGKKTNRTNEQLDRYIECHDIDHRAVDKFINCTEFLRLATSKENNIARINPKVEYNTFTREYRYGIKTSSGIRLSDEKVEALRNLTGVVVMRGCYDCITIKNTDLSQFLNIKKQCLEIIFGGFTPNIRYNFAPILNSKIPANYIESYAFVPSFMMDNPVNASITSEDMMIPTADVDVTTNVAPRVSERDFYFDLAYRYFITREVSESDMLREKMDYYVDFPEVIAQLSFLK